MERIAVYPGSFDPITEGHLDVIRRGLRLFDRVVVLIGHNPAKAGCFTPEERKTLIERCIADLPGASCAINEGLTVSWARSIGACAMIRGVRGASDLDAEETLAALNRQIDASVETVFLPAAPAYRTVSSSAVRELARYHAPLTGFVPDRILEDVIKRFESTTEVIPCLRKPTAPKA